MTKVVPLIVAVATFCLPVNAFALAAEPASLPNEFHFPASRPDPMVEIRAHHPDEKKSPGGEAKLVIDGVVTDGPYHTYVPYAYRINARLFFIHDWYDGIGYIWNRPQKELLPLGQCSLTGKTPRGALCYRRVQNAESHTYELIDFDPQTGQPRVLAADLTTTSIVGVWKDGIVFAVGRGRMLGLWPGKPPREFELDLKGWGFAPSQDAIRGDRALLMKSDFVGLGHLTGKLPEFTVRAAILNLSTGVIEPIGEFEGGWFTGNAVPDPVANLVWITKERAEQIKLRDDRSDALGRLLLRGTAYVVEGTEKLLQ